MLEKIAMKALAPMLNKVVDAFTAVDENYGVRNSYFVIHRVYDQNSRKVGAAITFMADLPDGTNGIVVDPKTGKELTYPITKLVDLIQGNTEMDEEEEDD